MGLANFKNAWLWGSQWRIFLLVVWQPLVLVPLLPPVQGQGREQEQRPVVYTEQQLVLVHIPGPEPDHLAAAHRPASVDQFLQLLDPSLMGDWESCCHHWWHLHRLR